MGMRVKGPLEFCLAPGAFDQDKAMTVVLPMGRLVNGVSARWQIPMPGSPDITPVMPVPVAADPDVVTGRTGDNDFVHGRRRRFGDENLSGC